MTKQKDEVWGVLWQDTTSKSPEKFLKDALEYCRKKYKTPTEIHVNRKFSYEEKEYEGIELIVDLDLYDKSLLWLVL